MERWSQGRDERVQRQWLDGSKGGPGVTADKGVERVCSGRDG